MFCPGCGSEQHSQYCRSCGMDLRRVYSTLEKQDEIKQQGLSARDEIGRAVADKIREAKSAKELNRIVEEVLPNIDKFLESPEAKRLRRIRAGMITAAVGLGAAVAFFILGWLNKDNGDLFVACLGLTVFLIGLGILLNGWLFTVPRELDENQISGQFVKTAAESLINPEPKTSTQEPLFPLSVSEHTTHQLPDSEPHLRKEKI